MPRNIYMGIVGMVVIFATVALVAALFSIPIPDTNRDMVNVASGTLLGAFVSVVSFYFGSSKSSRDKDERAVQTSNQA